MVASIHGKPSRMGQYTVYCLEGRKKRKMKRNWPSTTIIPLFLSYFPFYQLKFFPCSCLLSMCYILRKAHIFLMATFSINVWLRFKFDFVSCSCHNCCPMPRSLLCIHIHQINWRSFNFRKEKHNACEIKSNRELKRASVCFGIIYMHMHSHTLPIACNQNECFPKKSEITHRILTPSVHAYAYVHSKATSTKR